MDEMREILLEKYGLFMNLVEVAELFRLERDTLYQQIYRGDLDLPHLKRGKKYLFPTHKIHEYLVKNIDM